MGLFDIFRKKIKSHSPDRSVERKASVHSQQSPRNGVDILSPSSSSGALPKKRPRRGKKKMKGTRRLTVSKFNKQRKTQPKTRKPRDVFPDDAVSHLARALKGDEWERLAYSLGFLAQGVSHFTGRASSSQNVYSQACLMLTTWRDQTAKEDIIPRLTTSLQKIRRHDLALKVGLELGVLATSDLTGDKDVPKRLKRALNVYSSEQRGPPYPESKLVFGDARVSFLARQLLKREEWYRLAFALGFYPDEVSQIVASASSSQNLYTQAHLMLMTWRDRTQPNQIVPSLKAAFIRIRRHDLVDLLKIGAICGDDDIEETIDTELEALNEKIKKDGSFGASIASKLKHLQF